MQRRSRRSRRSATRSDHDIPFDARRTAGGVAGFEAGTGVAHGILAVVIALGLAILVEPLRRLVRARFRS